MLRRELEDKDLNDVLKIVNDKHGLTKGNSLVAREMCRIYNTYFPLSIIKDVKKEAAIRVLCGQQDRKNPLQKDVGV
jgi:hypothetical protein